uniref:C-type lectin domain-containing protein n=1 Tax=Laticauda laticaudata TaxID=8630 RepID=A0A8C5SZJ2_LATLA
MFDSFFLICHWNPPQFDIWFFFSALDNLKNHRYSNMGNTFIECLLDLDLFFPPLVSLINKPTLNPDDCKLLLAVSEHGRRPCLTDWIGYQMKCFYFSDKEETWSASQDFCSLYNASLAIIEKAFTDQHYKGSISHWIGLQRDPKQPWKWVNGNEFGEWRQANVV